MSLLQSSYIWQSRDSFYLTLHNQLDVQTRKNKPNFPYVFRDFQHEYYTSVITTVTTLSWNRSGIYTPRRKCVGYYSDLRIAKFKTSLSTNQWTSFTFNCKHALLIHLQSNSPRILVTELLQPIRSTIVNKCWIFMRTSLPSYTRLWPHNLQLKASPID